MAVARERFLKPLGAGLLALAAGVVAGGLWKSKPPLIQRQDQEERGAEEASAITGSMDPDAGKKARRDRRERGEGETLRFSRNQWSMLVRRQERFSVGPSDVMPMKFGGEQWKEGSVSLDARDTMGDPPPRLGPHAKLFGWDYELSRQVREALLEFGDELAAEEARGYEVTYPEPGVIRFDLSESRQEREAAVAEMKRKLGGILGETDSQRFLAIMGLEGASRGLPDAYEITARPGERGGLVIQGPNPTTLRVKRGPGADPPLTLEDVDGYPTLRLSHLTRGVEWSRLDPGRTEEAGP